MRISDWISDVCSSDLRGVPVDTLGIQSHLVTSGPDIGATVARQEGDWRAFLDAVVAMEYRLIITELDVRDTGLAAPFAVRDPLVADYTRAYLDIMLGDRKSVV